jgi:hypothetical protein
MAFSIERYAYVCPHRFGITTDTLSGSPNRHCLSILLQFVSKIHRYFFVLVTPGRICSSQGSPIRQILQLSLGSSSFCLACGSINLSISHATHNKCLIVPISILNGNLGYQSYRQHIIWSMVLWFEGISKYCA